MFSWLPIILGILPAIPQLISALETAWKGVPKSGPQKWIGVEQALSQSIQTAGAEIVKAVPNAKVDEVTNRVAVWAKAVNDATVACFNDVGLLSHGQ